MHSGFAVRGCMVWDDGVGEAARVGGVGGGQLGGEDGAVEGFGD